MGSSKKHRDRDSRKKRPASDVDETDSPREKRHKHHHKHKHRRDKERKKEKVRTNHNSDDSDDVVEVQIDQNIRKTSPERAGVSKSEEANNSSSVESLSIEETNKLRAKLGLKPLEVGSSSAQSNSKESVVSDSDDKFKDDWGEFHHKPAENWKDKAQQEKIRNKLVEQKEKRRLQSHYSKVKSLGQSDSDDDVNSWVDKSRKLDQEKKEAERRKLEISLPYLGRLVRCR